MSNHRSDKNALRRCRMQPVSLAGQREIIPGLMVSLLLCSATEVAFIHDVLKKESGLPLAMSTLTEALVQTQCCCEKLTKLAKSQMTALRYLSVDHEKCDVRLSINSSLTAFEKRGADLSKLIESKLVQLQSPMFNVTGNAVYTFMDATLETISAISAQLVVMLNYYHEFAELESLLSVSMSEKIHLHPRNLVGLIENAAFSLAGAAAMLDALKDLIARMETRILAN